ncbi:DMT family transporter [Fusibacter tunisiensis]|uniref:Drug/metabolite transporter (DMT)-like permease n=1 Tax=Fusibacter tunisiensis TaxID=1008308 RepID=A0ABS2MRS6_9FIRM|nr:DMT family transporter [Fusibacter tunisiensis]MBM7562070.1 drug/metabolite transporter (DMT)-like permease [Fusibacter tunisiensis]
MKKKGIVYILLSALFFSIMAAFVKSIPEIPLTEKMFFRNFIGLIAISVTLYRKKATLKPKRPVLMVGRALFGLAGVGLYYAALERLPLANAVMLNKLSPFFVVIFAVLFLHEKVNGKQKTALLIAILGAALVVRPGPYSSVFPGLLALMSAAFAGAAYTLVRKLTQTDAPMLIVFYFCLISSVILLPIMAVEGLVVPDVKQLISLIGIGVSALIAQLFMTNAYQYAPASELSIYTYSDILFSFGIGIIIWSELPDLIALFGGILIVIAGIINYVNGLKKV